MVVFTPDLKFKMKRIDFNSEIKMKMENRFLLVLVFFVVAGVTVQAQTS